jgi:hypothetical protein
MGILLDLNTGASSVLEAEHIIGRAPGCSLRIDERYISAQHAALRWSPNRGWELKDLGSLNGTFLDGVRVHPGGEVLVKKGSRLGFGKLNNQWEIVDDAAPKVMVVPLDGGAPLVVTGALLVLPTEDRPECTLYRSEGSWYIERAHEVTSSIGNMEIFDVDGRRFRFCYPEQRLPTALATTPKQKDIRDLRVIFSVSQDEEHVELRALYRDQAIALGSRAFNYLLLTLARHRLRDIEDGVSDGDAGWICYEDYANDPSMAPAQLALDVYRIRRLFERAGIEGAAEIIQRRPRIRQLRIGTAHVQIARI